MGIPRIAHLREQISWMYLPNPPGISHCKGFKYLMRICEGMIIAVSGTPGTGKTTIAKQLAEELGYAYVDVNKVIDEQELAEGYDEQRDCKIVDTEKLNAVLIRMIKQEKDLVIDSHLSHFLPKKYVDRCIITICELPELKKRLEKRGYKASKVRENLDAEIFDSIAEEAKELGHEVFIIDTTDGCNVKELVQLLELE